MATVAPPSDQAADLLQKLSLDSQTKILELPEPTKKASGNQFGAVESADATNCQIQPYERSLTPILPDCMDPSVCYLPNGYPSTAYYYGGYDGTAGEWDEYPRYVNTDVSEMPSGVYGDNGSLLYHGYGYGPYAPYSPAGSPVPTLGHDGQLYGPQHYQYPTSYFQPLNPTSGPYSPSPTALSKFPLSSSVPAEQVPLPIETANGKGNSGSVVVKATHQNPTFNSNGSHGRCALPGGTPASGLQDPRYAFDGVRSPIHWLDGPLFPDMQSRSVTNPTISSSISSANNNASRNPNLHPHSHLVGLHHPRPMTGMGGAHGYINRMYPSKMCGQFGNALRSGLGFGSNGYDSWTNGRGWLGVDNKFRPRGRNNGFFGYGNENMDGLNELNRGPRAKNTKKPMGFAPVTLAVKGQNGAVVTDDENLSADREQYNQSDFSVKHNDSKFFIIKSYSEDDVHKSIKYNVWASTPNGNKKLDAAYQEAQEKSGGCSVFLLFSVNTSGQFVGIAEMLGPVDFHKNVEYWQQDKWNGCFPVKWHIVKDVPNSLLKHITLENNENKPVTNSRDTQEVKLDQGLQMIKIFKEYSSKTCILDDFGFYEARQKTIQEKKAKQQQYTKQVWEGKPADDKSKEGANGELRSPVASDLINESAPAPAIQTNGDAKHVIENSSVPKTCDAPVIMSEKRVIQNGIANGC